MRIAGIQGVRNEPNSGSTSRKQYESTIDIGTHPSVGCAKMEEQNMSPVKTKVNEIKKFAEELGAQVRIGYTSAGDEYILFYKPRYGHFA